MRASFDHGEIAQSVEQRIENPRVPGSIPGLATTFSTIPDRAYETQKITDPSLFRIDMFVVQ